ncbi:MAG: hypothetical protein AB1486_26430 [Planctomycetota bacterium]
MRSLAHDFADSLGCGGHLMKLRRLAVGDFRVEDALRIQELAQLEIVKPRSA